MSIRCDRNLRQMITTRDFWHPKKRVACSDSHFMRNFLSRNKKRLFYFYLENFSWKHHQNSQLSISGGKNSRSVPHNNGKTYSPFHCISLPSRLATKICQKTADTPEIRQRKQCLYFACWLICQRNMCGNMSKTEKKKRFRFLVFDVPIWIKKKKGPRPRPGKNLPNRIGIENI